ncbi:DUF3857 domain-containing transglutaminase family protein [Spirosoma rhododendri]|uniref:DUF3857 and transglutaminase domain-containing protein n=1 Tax=Spirosoma rhododendri TaxID=2728024 RepID=A0A7L5DW30_9BACT|nr:DUF3857 domain-containing protein [Spirosoma rhododendri]QJD80838.1 DUF3857 and transglutaminase domain-containing protein [Spirosoma rhododendri]
MKYTLIGLLCLGGKLACAQSEYQSSTLPDALRENAHSVVRRHETQFIVKSPGEATKRVRRVVTVLDEQGDDQAVQVAGYDKLSAIDEFTGALYDASGTLIRKLKKADIADQSSQSTQGFYDDQRYRSASFPKQPGYPYTVEFVLETTEKNLMLYPTWIPQNDEHLSVEQATFTVQMPKGLTLRHKAVNISAPVSVSTTSDGRQSFTWTLANLPALVLEPLSPPAREQLPIVYTAPSAFDVQRYSGNLSTWRDLGRFYHTLNAGRDQLPEAVQQEVVDLVKSEPTTAGKVARIYRHLQDHTRYVSIQLGIGGWQTIDAASVAKSHYGDCKALTNYMKAMLTVAGIPAYPVLVRAGENESDARIDFPSFQFNHVVLCVPNGRDTTFLECTNNLMPPGYMSDFTGNRHGLLVLPDGGRIIQMPVYRPADNRQQRQIQVTIGSDGTATAAVRTHYTGLQHDTYAQAMHALSHDEQRNWLIKRISIPSFELGAFGYKAEVGPLPAVTENLSLTARQWAKTSGSRLFLPLNLLSAQTTVPPTLSTPRRTPLVMNTNYDYEDTDTVVYQVPEGYAPEFKLDPTVIESAFGRYSAQVAVEGKKVTYIRRMSMHGGRYPATTYTDWVAFRRKVARADRAQLVFVKSN